MSGLAPGTLVHIGERTTGKVKITVLSFSESDVAEAEVENIGEALPYRKPGYITWINIDGVHELSIVEEVGKHFNIHPLLLEDVVNTEQRPKVDDFDDYVFVVLRMLSYGEESHSVESEQVSLILGQDVVISFQEKEEDDFKALRERIKCGKGRVRKSGADYLTYSIMDAVVDSYFIVLEKLGERIESLEDQLVEDPLRSTLVSIHQLKQETAHLRKAVWPLREVIGALQRGEFPAVTPATTVYLRDLYDHTVQVVETTEAFRDVLAGMLDIYLSSVSNRMNEVMKVLTIIATIFMPLSFFAGVYGMNFEHMPELGWRFGYLMFWGVILTVFLVMFTYFKRKKWM